MSNKGTTNVKLGVDDKKLKKGLKDGQSQMKKFGSAIMKMGGLLAAAFGIGKLIKFGKESVKLADIQQKAEAQLLTALGGRKKAQLDLMNQASKLQKITLFGDEETIKAQALIAAFVDEADQIKQIIPLVQDMAAAKGMDLANAADLVSKTLGSSTNALSRYGIEVKGAVGSTERLASLAKGMGDAFAGSAEAMAKAGTGPVKQFFNALGDMQERIGGKLIPTLNKAAKFFTKLVTPKASDQLRQEKDDVNMLIGVITDEITTKKDRLTLLNKLQSQYPDFLGNLNIEKVTNKELVDQLKLVNTEYDKKIALAIKEELIAERKSELAKLYSKQYKKQLELEKQESQLQANIAQGAGDLAKRYIQDKRDEIKVLQDKRKEIYANVAAIMKLVEAENVAIVAGGGGKKTSGKPARTAPAKITPLGGSVIKNLGLSNAAAQSMNIETQALANMNPILERNIELHNNLAAAAARLAEETLKASLMNEFFTGTAMAVGSAELKSAKDTGEALKMMGKAMANAAKDAIATSLARAVASTVASALESVPFPFNLIAAPIAGVAAMTLFNAAIPEFAQGGAAFGPTLGMVGEAPGISRSNPEYIGTAKQLGLGGGRLKVDDIIIEGTKLRIVLDEVDRQNSNSY